MEENHKNSFFEDKSYRRLVFWHINKNFYLLNFPISPLHNKIFISVVFKTKMFFAEFFESLAYEKTFC